MAGNCTYCQATATHEVEAGRPGPGHDYRAQLSCAQHLDRACRWAAPAGPVTVRRIAEDPQPSLFGEAG